MAGERGSVRRTGPTARALMVVALVCGAVTALAAPPAQNNKPPSKKRLVCWTDDAGHRACGDAVPARYADKEKRIIDGSGRTVKTIPGALTADQLAEQEEQARRDAVAQRESDQQAAYDRALLATYARPEELAALRDDRLATIDISIDVSESAARRDSVSIAELRARVPAGKQPDAKLATRIAEQEALLADNQRAIAELRKNRDSVCATFARDIRRFQELKSGAVAFDSPCPPIGAFEQAQKNANVDLDDVRRFFDRFTELERDFDPALLDLYAKDAMGKTVQKRPDGQVEKSEAPIAKYRAAAQKTRETFAYSEVTVQAEGANRARIRALRTSEKSRKATPFEMVVRPSAKGWRIVEESSGPQS